jgi:hypothetical protein
MITRKVDRSLCARTILAKSAWRTLLRIASSSSRPDTKNWFCKQDQKRNLQVFFPLARSAHQRGEGMSDHLRPFFEAKLNKQYPDFFI